MTYFKVFLKRESFRGADGKDFVTFKLLCEDLKLHNYLKILCSSIVFVQELHDPAALSDYIMFYSLEHDVDSLDKHKYKSVTERNSLISKKRLANPVLHWSMYDLFALSETPLSKIYYTPRYVKYLDSSIWDYFFPLFVLAKNGIGQEEWMYNKDIKHLEYILNAIWENTCNGIYEFANAYEYYELNTRLVTNAYLVDRAHGQAVSPFVFHSEYEMKKALSKCLTRGEEEKQDTNFCCNVKWRLLLVDDYADKPLKEARNISQTRSCRLRTNRSEDECTSVKPTGKLKVIIDNLQSKGCTDIVWCCPAEEEIEERYNNRNNDLWQLKPWRWYDKDGKEMKRYTNPDVAIVCAQNVKQAFLLLILQRYDVVLLDYLLGDRADKKGREYSYYLLELISGKCAKGDENLPCEFLGVENEYRAASKADLLGPDSCLYFMHISAFVSAIEERLREQHLLRNESFWHIAHGACPTNTPELFLYYLYRIMEKRYESIMKQDGQIVGTLIHFLGKIYEENPRMQSVNKFNALLNLRAQYNRIKKDVYKEERELLNMKEGDSFIKGCSPLDCRSSRLISSTFPDILYYGNSFWEHLQHLVYLTAYGTIRQWPEMWEEYSFIKPKLELNGDKGKKVCEAIENYIIALKSNS